MTDFIVRFEGVELSKEAERHLQAAIGAAVETAMGSAAFQPNPEGDGQCVFIPHRWLGRYILSQAALERDEGALRKQLMVTVGSAQRT
jgi:hypothetical protein